MVGWQVPLCPSFVQGMCVCVCVCVDCGVALGCRRRPSPEDALKMWVWNVIDPVSAVNARIYFFPVLSRHFPIHLKVSLVLSELFV